MFTVLPPSHPEIEQFLLSCIPLLCTLKYHKGLYDTINHSPSFWACLAATLHIFLVKTSLFNDVLVLKGGYLGTLYDFLSFNESHTFIKEHSQDHWIKQYNVNFYPKNTTRSICGDKMKCSGCAIMDLRAEWIHK